ncbi:hypothetical protein A165_05960 [Vibrio tasmaniensis ZS-17]|nr:hypothetical protein A165_05960 [Vibrio tasmaniensis ZS-17]
MFYSTDISVTLWIISKNKKQHNVHLSDQNKQYRNREGEVLFVDLRRRGSEFEKKYTQLTNDDITEIASLYHNWQQLGWENSYANVAEFCQSVSLDEIKEKEFSLIPSKYIPFIDADNEMNFEAEMNKIQKDFSSLLKQEIVSQKELIDAFKGLGYELNI